MKKKRPKRSPPRPASVEDGIRDALKTLNWRMDSFFTEKRPDTDTQARVKRGYDLGFAILSAEKLLKLLRWKVRGRALWGSRIVVRAVDVPPAMSDVRLSETPDDLVRRQRDRDQK